jgi:dienelactone hydrolase
MPTTTAVNLLVRDGLTLAGVVDWPDGPGPFATVVLAPGQRYALDKPLIASTALALLARGMAVYRFDWAASPAVANLDAATDLARRVEDMRAVVRTARSDERVDPMQVFVGGKSLGSVVAWALMRSDPMVRGALLLTPLCGATSGPVRPLAPITHYPDMARETRPVFFLAGDTDPLCDVAALHRLAAQAGGPTPIHVLGGDHALADPAGSNPDAETSRAEFAGRLAADFAAEHVAR